ncbi:helix-turn-helix domain-containing protein [Nonomuraea sp. KM90]|uniref:helix-turn-helix domain-containing protein n=1 Tax=Nonomuraea sp. KM90 TaxID=3457428 RepID=UPI003FCDC337
MSAESSRVAVRARIVLACAGPGISTAQVARDLGLAESTVRKWRAAFARGGLEALADDVRTGRPKAELARCRRPSGRCCSGGRGGPSPRRS